VHIKIYSGFAQFALLLQASCKSSCQLYFFLPFVSLNISHIYQVYDAAFSYNVHVVQVAKKVSGNDDYVPVPGKKRVAHVTSAGLVISAIVLLL